MGEAPLLAIALSYRLVVTLADVFAAEPFSWISVGQELETAQLIPPPPVRRRHASALSHYGLDDSHRSAVLVRSAALSLVGGMGAATAALPREGRWSTVGWFLRSAYSAGDDRLWLLSDAPQAYLLPVLGLAWDWSWCPSTDWPAVGPAGHGWDALACLDGW